MGKSAPLRLLEVCQPRQRKFRFSKKRARAREGRVNKAGKWARARPPRFPILSPRPVSSSHRRPYSLLYVLTLRATFGPRYTLAREERERESDEESEILKKERKKSEARARRRRRKSHFGSFRGEKKERPVSVPLISHPRSAVPANVCPLRSCFCDQFASSHPSHSFIGDLSLEQRRELYHPFVLTPKGVKLKPSVTQSPNCIFHSVFRKEPIVLPATLSEIIIYHSKRSAQLFHDFHIQSCFRC